MQPTTSRKEKESRECKRFPGAMSGFAAVKPGDFFVYFDDQGSAFGMKIYDLSKKTVAVISFSVAGQRLWDRLVLSLPPPVVGGPVYPSIPPARPVRPPRKHR